MPSRASGVWRFISRNISLRRDRIPRRLCRACLHSLPGSRAPINTMILSIQNIHHKGKNTRTTFQCLYRGYPLWYQIFAARSGADRPKSFVITHHRSASICDTVSIDADQDEAATCRRNRTGIPNRSVSAKSRRSGHKIIN